MSDEEKTEHKRELNHIRVERWRAAHPGPRKFTEAQKQHQRDRAKAWHWANREKANAGSKARYEANKSRHYELTRARIAANPEANREYMLEYYKKNTKQAIARAKAWKLANPDKVKLSNAKRKAQKLGTEIGEIDFNNVILKANGMCGICNFIIEGDYHYDHIEPLAAGGSHTEDNLQLAHPICNFRKKANPNYIPPSILKKTPKGLVLESAAVR